MLRLHTDEGIVGVGEAGVQTQYLGDTPAHIMALWERWWPALRGQDPFRIGALHQTMKTPYAGYKVAEAAVDEALYDIVGQALGQPVYRLLGGGFRTQIELFGTVGYAGIDVEPLQAMTWRERTPELLLEQAKAFMRAGHRGIELKAGGYPATNAYVRGRIKLIGQVLDVVPPEVQIVVDLNQGWDVVTTINVFGQFRGVPNLAIEQPIPHLNIGGLAQIKRALDLPLIADEAAMSPEAIVELARAEAADGINLKINRAGGIYPALRMIATAEAAGMQVHIDYTPLTKIGDTVNAHVATQIRQNTPHALDGYTWFDERALGDMGITYQDARAQVPAAPGLGIDITDEALAPLRSELPVRVLAGT
ncbi:MAG TPA: mandelate racemase/muconate lactonizing enzyme family protein [Kofleriaceae bacterium]|nr:mandelate racemase/muconate lactonizing enzyme family protein [Kofleriaceae bacterium]